MELTLKKRKAINAKRERMEDYWEVAEVQAELLAEVQAELLAEEVFLSGIKEECEL